MNRYGVGLATDPEVEAACGRACALAAATGGQGPPDLAVVFAAGAHGSLAALAGPLVAEQLDARIVFGAVGVSGVIGGGREVEEGPGVTLLAAWMPDATLHAATLRYADGAITGLDADWPIQPAGLIVVADPYSIPADALLAALGACWPGVPVVGGLAGGEGPGQARLFAGREVLDGGAVVVAVAPALAPVVSQGCRPIGPDLVVTATDRNAILELAGRPALEKLREVLERASATDRALAATGLLAGLVIDENRPDYGVGDFLVRGLLGADPATGAIAIGDLPRVGQTFRFHVRDEESAGAELDHLLAHANVKPGAALLFSCNGRGSNMFSRPDHDARAVEAALGVSASGLFCQGEIGPVGGQNHLHGFTATLALFPR